RASSSSSACRLNGAAAPARRSVRWRCSTISGSPHHFHFDRELLQMLLGHNRKMTGAECLADMLKGYGVTHVFHVPAVLRTTFVEMERRTDIKRLHVHGEKAAAYMADGYARASGKPGICMAQVIGALNLAAGL